MTERIVREFGSVKVLGPVNNRSRKWYLDMMSDGMALSWNGNKARARLELESLRAALDFIEGQVFEWGAG